jgi:hypothetical protein
MKTRGRLNYTWPARAVPFKLQRLLPGRSLASCALLLSIYIIMYIMLLSSYADYITRRPRDCKKAIQPARAKDSWHIPKANCMVHLHAHALGIFIHHETDKHIKLRHHSFVSRSILYLDPFDLHPLLNLWSSWTSWTTLELTWIAMPLKIWSINTKQSLI